MRYKVTTPDGQVSYVDAATPEAARQMVESPTTQAAMAPKRTSAFQEVLRGLLILPSAGASLVALHLFLGAIARASGASDASRGLGGLLNCSDFVLSPAAFILVGRWVSPSTIRRQVTIGLSCLVAALFGVLVLSFFVK